MGMVRGAGYRVLGAGCWVLSAVLSAGCRVLRMLVYDELRRRHPGAKDALGTDVEARHGEAAESPLQVLERQAGIEHRAERHVAGDPGETVEVQKA